jgi:TfoX/Sxy family transcriptional regulator of competence genes
MAWKKTPPEVLAALEGARPKDPRVVTRPMFGYTAYFANGNMIGGTFQDAIMVRVAEGDAEKLIAARKALPFEPMAGRPMKGYVRIPPADVAKPKALAGWLDRALDATLKVPAKGPAQKTAKKATRTPAKAKRV